MKMRYVLELSVAVLAIMSFLDAADAAIISVTDSLGNPDIEIVAGTTSVDAYVRISPEAGDTGTLQAIVLGFSVGDGGEILGGTDVVPVMAVDFVAPGSIFAGQPLLISFGTPLPGASAVLGNVTLNVPNTNVNYASDSLFAVVSLDTSGLNLGDGPFVLSANALGVTAVTFAAGGGLAENVNLNFVNGSLSVTAVPEPSTMMFLSDSMLAGWGIRRRRARSLQNEHDSM